MERENSRSTNMSRNMNMLGSPLIMPRIKRRELGRALRTRRLNAPRKRRINISRHRRIRHTTIRACAIRIPKIDVDIRDRLASRRVDDLDIEDQIDARLDGGFTHVGPDVFAGDVEGAFGYFGHEDAGIVAGEDVGEAVGGGVCGGGEVVGVEDGAGVACG